MKDDLFLIEQSRYFKNTAILYLLTKFVENMRTPGEFVIDYDGKNYTKKDLYRKYSKLPEYKRMLKKKFKEEMKEISKK